LLQERRLIDGDHPLKRWMARLQAGELLRLERESLNVVGQRNDDLHAALGPRTSPKTRTEPANEAPAVLGAMTKRTEVR
jgi:hypothetical protein